VPRQRRRNKIHGGPVVRRRILLLVVGMTTLVVLAFAVPLAILIRHNVYNDALTSLQDETNQIALYLRSDDGAPSTAQLDSYLAKQDSDRSASVQLPNGQLVGTKPPGEVAELPALPARDHGFGGPDGDDPGRGGPTQATTAWRGGRLAQLQVPAPNGDYVVRVYARDDALHAGETGWWLLLGGASVGLLLLGVVAGELLTRRIVRPLVHTADTAQRLAAGDVTARATTDGPVEVAEVGRSLNRLADRIDELIAEERETVADMSHRLRTPLTALRLDAESLTDPADAELVGAHVTALERMLTAIIRAARRPQREGRLPSCDATEVVGRRVAFWSALAEDQERRSTVQLPARPLVVRAGADDLAAAVDALLENVIAHTPEGTAFAVRLSNGSGAHLEVADDGPGLPPDAHIRGRSDRGSSGLGLDIARRCAEASGGSMTLAASPSGGTLVRLDLGTP
jgi:signal transduction histidine kinase